MGNSHSLTKGITMSKVTGGSRQRVGADVALLPDWTPLAWGHATTGTLFMVKGTNAYVIWTGETTPSIVHADAIRYV